MTRSGLSMCRAAAILLEKSGTNSPTLEGWMTWWATGAEIDRMCIAGPLRSLRNTPVPFFLLSFFMIFLGRKNRAHTINNRTFTIFLVAVESRTRFWNCHLFWCDDYYRFTSSLFEWLIRIWKTLNPWATAISILYNYSYDYHIWLKYPYVYRFMDWNWKRKIDKNFPFHMDTSWV